jgi:1-deoxy-D-xylulose-5-phosphate reductoisomerase
MNLAKKLAIFGSTGSIGRNSLEVVRNLNRNNYPVNIRILSANSNYELLYEQITEFHPEVAVIFDTNGYNILKNRLTGSNTEILFGSDDLISSLKQVNFDLLINAQVGFSGLIPTIEAVKLGKSVALANKESLVIAGELIEEISKTTKSKFIPIDSEHSAILQCLQGENFKTVSKIILTASGGPFLNTDISEFQNVSVENALKHPNWKMGNKITIDSATLMNKGFEIIEGKWLFNIDVDFIQVLIHPQSIIHSLVEFVDGSVKAQLGCPDMKVPIQYAITYPERITSDFPKLNLIDNNNLTFFEPEIGKFECLKLAYDAIHQGGLYPAVLNSANDIAVGLFLGKKIKFPEIPYLINLAMQNFSMNGGLTIENILNANEWTKNFIAENLKELNKSIIN